MLPDEITTKELAALVGVSPRTARELVDRGVIERVGKDRFKITAVAAYCTHIRGVAAGRGGEAAGNDLAGERARLAKLQADQVGMKNDQLQKVLVHADEIGAAWSDIARRIRSGILAVPSRVLQKLPHLSLEEVAEIDRELRDALTAIGNDADDASTA